MIQPKDTPPSEEPTHVDEFIWEPELTPEPEKGDVTYARWILMHLRLPAHMQFSFKGFMEDKKLFCTYEGIRYRCTGGSRLGDVWLAKDFKQDVGYDKRVNVDDCFHWSPNP